MTRVRLQDVAERAGVSAQTVSRALRAPHLVAPPTVARIQAIMEDLGYYRNEQAAALRAGRTRTIGLLFAFLGALPMPFPLEVIAGAEERAFEQGFSLVMCDCGTSDEKEAEQLALLLSQRVAGIIYTAPRCRPETHLACASLLKSDVPVVVISSDEQDLPYSHVRTDDKRAGYVATRHLYDLGRRRLAVVAGTHVGAGGAPAVSPPIRDRLAGAANAAGESGFVSGDVDVYLVPETSEGGRAAGDDMLTRTRLPDGVFCTTDMLAIGLQEALRSAGVRVPEELAIVGHDDLFTSAISVPSLTTIAPPRRQMGRVCVDLLIGIDSGGGLTATHMLDADLIVRESTIGVGPRARQGIRSPISADRTWASWRTQMFDDRDPSSCQQPAVARSMLSEFTSGNVGSDASCLVPSGEAKGGS